MTTSTAFYPFASPSSAWVSQSSSSPMAPPSLPQPRQCSRGRLTAPRSKSDLDECWELLDSSCPTADLTTLPERPSPPVSYTARLASWSQPTAASPAGFRVGHGGFSPSRAQPRAVISALWRSNSFLANLPPPPSEPPSPLSAPFALPQVVAGSSTAPFVRASSESFGPAGLPTELFVRFLDVINALLIAGSGSPQIGHGGKETEEEPYSLSPPNYTARPSPLDTFLAAVNRHMFFPRNLQCHFLVSAALERRLLGSHDLDLSSATATELLNILSLDPAERRTWMFRDCTLPARSVMQQYPPSPDIINLYTDRAADVSAEKRRYSRAWEKEGRSKAVEALARGKRDKVENEVRRVLTESRVDLWLLVENL